LRTPRWSSRTSSTWSARAHLISQRGVEGPPTLLVEVLSPGTATVDRGTKFQLYARLGVPCYWIVDVNGRAVEAYEATAGAYRLVGRASGATPTALPPFLDLAIVPDALWRS
jgi:Uma2 family endonuclease